MKSLHNSYPVVFACLALAACALLWRNGALSDGAVIAILLAALMSSMLRGHLLANLLRRQALEKGAWLAESTQMHAHIKMLRQQAYYDHLTGLGNRNLLADRFKFAVERFMRSKATFALLMIDLNHFKFINDNYGHSAGDEVLITSSKRLVAAVRGSDTVVRLGGDEFLLLIERAGKCNDVFNLGQKLIDSLSEEIALSTGEVVSVGASVGIAQFPKDGHDFGRLVEFADQSMYECKTSGRMPLEIE